MHIAYKDSFIKAKHASNFPTKSLNYDKCECCVCTFGKPTVPSAFVAFFFFFCTNNSLNNILFLQHNSITVVQPCFSWTNQVLNNSSVLCGEKYPQHSATESSLPQKQNNLTQVCGSTSSPCVSAFQMNQDGAHTSGRSAVCSFH